MITLTHYQASHQRGCLPACVKMLAAQWGIDESEQFFVEVLGTEERGSHWWDLPKIENVLPVKVMVGKGIEDRLIKCLEQKTPPILAVTAMGEAHTIILAGLDDGTAFIHDPAQPEGPITLERELLIENWLYTGRCLATVEFAPERVSFIYDANGNPQDVYSLAPERQTNFGRIEKVTGILLSENTIDLAQPESNTLAGLYRAWKNIRFPHVRVPAKNNRFLEPATQDYFAIVLAAEDTIRGLVWESKEFITTEVSYEINVEKGYLLVDVTGEASTWGPDGVAGPYRLLPFPDEPPDEPLDYWPIAPTDDPPPWFPPDMPIASACTWNVAVCVMTDGFYTTDDITAAPPTWTQRVTGLAGGWRTINDADMVTTSEGDYIYVATNVGIARSTDYAANWVQLTLPDPTGGETWASGNVYAESVKFDPTDSNRIFAIVVDSTNIRMWAYRSQNALAETPIWDQWPVQVKISGFWTWPAGKGPNELCVASNGNIWFLAEDFLAGAGQVLRAFRSTDHGDSYIEISPTSMPENANSGIDDRAGIRVGWHDPGHVYVFGRWYNSGTAQVERFRFCGDGGTTWITRENGLPADGAGQPRGIYSVRQSPSEPRRLVGTVEVVDDLYATSNEGLSWSRVNASWGPFQSDCCEFLMTNPLVIVAGTDSNLDAVRLIYSADGGVTDIDKTSTLPARITNQILLPLKWW